MRVEGVEVLDVVKLWKVESRMMKEEEEALILDRVYICRSIWLAPHLRSGGVESCLRIADLGIAGMRQVWYFKVLFGVRAASQTSHLSSTSAFDEPSAWRQREELLMDVLEDG